MALANEFGMYSETFTIENTHDEGWFVLLRASTMIGLLHEQGDMFAAFPGASYTEARKAGELVSEKPYREAVAALIANPGWGQQ